MFPCTAEKSIGFQRLICKNPFCKHLLKTIVFIEGGETRVYGESRVFMVKSNSVRYYICPKCKAQNFVILEGEEILLEKIVSYAMPKHELQQKGLQKYQVAIDSVIRKTQRNRQQVDQ